MPSPSRARRVCTASRMPARPRARRACATRSNSCKPNASATASARWRIRARSSCSRRAASRSKSAPPQIALPASALAEHPHPYLDFDRLGCIVTIDADDPAIFRTSIAQEYALVEAVAGPAALERYVRNAIDASFAAARREARRCTRSSTAALAELRRRIAKLGRLCPDTPTPTLPNRSRCI